MNIDETLGQPRVVPIRGRSVHVNCVQMRNLKAFSLACAPFIDRFGAPVQAKSDDAEALDPFRLLCDFQDEMMAAIACVSDADVDYLGQLHPDEVLDIAVAMIEMNSAFFIHRLMPALNKVIDSVRRIGLMELTNSLALATERLPTSRATP